MFLIDTNVLSQLRNRSRADANVKAWAAQARDTELYLSVVTILEIERGVLAMERQDPRQGAHLRTWLENHILAPFDQRIMPITNAIARRCAALHVPNSRPDRDALIGATALVHGMTIVTRNVADFETTGAALLNPWTPRSTASTG